MHMMNQTVNSARLAERYVLYVDLGAILFFFVSVAMIVHDAYYLGFYQASGNGLLEGETISQMWRDVGILFVSVGWLLYRYFTMKAQEFANPWW